MISLIFWNITVRIDLFFVFIPALLHFFHRHSNGKLSLVSTKLHQSIRVLQVFLFLHLFYVFFSFNQIFIDCFTVNIQLILCLELVLYYLKFPLSVSETKKVQKVLNFFGFLLLFTTFSSKMGIVDFSPDVDKTEAVRFFGIAGDQEAWIYTIYATVFLFRKNYIYFLLFVAGILINGSIAPIALLIGCTVCFFYTYKYLLVFLTAFILLVSFIFSSDLNNLTIINRFADIDKLMTEGAGGHRLAALENAKLFFLENFLLGKGNFALYMQNEYKDLLNESEIGKLSILSSSNNQIIDFYLHFGFIGLILCLLYIFRLYEYLKYNHINVTNALNAKGLYVWFTVFIFVNQTATWFLPGSLFFIVFALFLSLNFSNEERATKV
jgi:hypothetical protein